MNHKNRDRIKRATHTALMRAQHFVHAGGWRGHHIHSPFVYHIVRHVISTRATDTPLQTATRNYRRRLLHDDTVLTVESMGAIVRGPIRRSVSAIAKRTSATPKYGMLLARLAKDLKPDGILELGTSMGMSTAYLAMGCPTARVVSLEGVECVADAAERHLRDAGLNNVTILKGNIDHTLEGAIDLLPGSEVQMAFIDANHSYEATKRYFETIIARANKQMCLMVFDDIFWSNGMTQAWHEIVADQRVMTTIELARTGLAFVRTGCQKEHYKVRW